MYGNRNGLELVKHGGNNRYCHAIFIDIDDGNVIKGNEKQWDRLVKSGRELKKSWFQRSDHVLTAKWSEFLRLNLCKIEENCILRVWFVSITKYILN